MANKNFKVRNGIEAPLIAADNGATAITLNNIDVSTVGDLIVGGNEIRNNGGNLAISMSSGETPIVTTAGRLIITSGDVEGGDGNVANVFALSAQNQVNLGSQATITSIGYNLGNILMEAPVILNSNLIRASGIEPGRIRYEPTSDKWQQSRNSGTTYFDIPISTAELAENTNLYYTDARSRAALSGGTGVTYDSGTGAISIGQAVATTSNVTFGTVDTTSLDVTNIRALDGTAAATIADSTGAVTVSTELTVDNININGNTIISTDTNGNITLDPNGTGNVSLTLADGGNLTNTRNYLFGPVRNANTLGRGNAWELLSTGSGTAPYRGFSADNGTDITKQSAVVLRNYGATAGNRSRVIFERSRGTAAAPTRVASGDLLGEVDATGYSDTGWLNDQVAAVPGFFGFTATENWTGTSNCGTGFILSLQPTGTLLAGGAQTPVIVANPQSVAFRTDAYSFRTRAGTTAAADYLSLASTGAIIKNGSNVELANFATGTATISADTVVLQKSNGTDLLQLTGDNSTLTTTRLRQVSAGLYGGEISTKAGIRDGATGFDRATELSVTAITTDGTASASYETKTNRFDGTNYAATQTGDILGRFTFLGNYSSGTSPASVNAAGNIAVKATENWTDTASGASMQINVNKTGTNDNVSVLDVSAMSSIYRSDAVAFRDSSNVSLPGGKIDYKRVHGCFHKTANVTADDPDTVYAFDWYTDTTAHVGDQGVTVTSGNPTRVNIDTAGRYTATLEMQAANTDNADRIAYIWLAKNGTDIAETRIRVKLQKENEQVITKLWLLENIAANDYIELRFAVDNESGISLNYSAAQTTPFVMPAQPSATFTIVPVGA